MSERSVRRAHARRTEREARRAALRRRAGLATGAALGAAALFATPAQAADLVVTSAGDGPADACDTSCTLRDAITAADGSSPDNTISFDPALEGQTIVLTEGEIPVDASMEIDGGDRDVTVSGGDASRIFSMAPAKGLILEGLDLTAGNGEGDAESGRGGAVFVGEGGSLIFARGSITGSSADSGGAIAGGSPDDPTGNSTSVALDYASLTGNTAESSTGGAVDLYGSLQLISSEISGNTSELGGGGAHLAGKYGSLTTDDATISGNTSGGSGGGILLESGTSSVDSVIEESTVSGNTAGDGDGGGVQAILDEDSELRVDRSTISGNEASADGGGLAIAGEGDLSLVHSTVSGNTAKDGGGVAAAGAADDDPGTFWADNSTIAANEASGEGGGLVVRQRDGFSRKVELLSTIVGDNTAAGAAEDLAGPAAPDEDVTLYESLIEEPGDVTPAEDPAGPSIIGSDPDLGPLATNGGKTLTHLPGSRSPAIDRGDDPGDVGTDQRGATRTVDLGPEDRLDGTDIGAVEVQTAPFDVNWVRRDDPSPTNADTVTFVVEFTEAAAGLDASDLMLTKTGTADGSVTSVEGSGATYTVTIGDVAGDGTLRLDVKAEGVESADAEEALPGPYARGEAYEIDNSGPVVTSIEPAEKSPTRADSVTFDVTFDEPTKGVDAADFSPTTDGTLADVSVTGVSGSAAKYTVTVDTGTGSGRLGLAVPGTATITDELGQPLTQAFTTGGEYVVDRTAPFVTAIERNGAEPTNDETVTFDVVFSENVTGVSAEDLAIDAEGVEGAGVESVTPIGVSPERRGKAVAPDDRYRVVVDTGTGDGRLSIDVLDDESIADGAGNTLDQAYTPGAAYTIDKTVPQLAINQASGQADPATGEAIAFTVTASEDVTGLTGTDVAVGGTAGATTAAVSGAGDVFGVSVTGMTKDGTVEATLPAGAVEDAAGNASLASTSADASVTWTKPVQQQQTPTQTQETAPPVVLPAPIVRLTCFRVPTLERHTLAYARRVLTRDGCTSPLVVDNPKPRYTDAQLVVVKQAPVAGTPRFGDETVRVIVKRKPRRASRSRQ